MSFLRRSNNDKPDFTSLQVQTSTSTLPIPIVWGQNKVAPNLVWFANFKAVPGSSGKGVGGKGGLFGGGASAGNSYTYTADLIMALCEGPLSPGGELRNGIGFIWKDLGVYVQLELGLGSFPGATPQELWPYLAALYPQNALAYQGTAYLWAGGYNLGDTASIGNHNVEVYGPLAGTGANGIDADPALVIQDFLTNAQYGCGFNPASIDGGSLFANPDSFQAYCRAMGYAFSPALTNQEQASSILTRWLQIFSTAAVWSGGLLKFIPYGDTAISTGQEQTFSIQLSIPVPIPVSSGGSLPALVNVASASQFVSDGGVVYAASPGPLIPAGTPLVFIGAREPTVAGEYGMFPSGTYVFGQADQGKPVVITYTAGSAGNFTPNLTPVYALSDTDFVDEKGNKDPVQVERVDVFSLPTIQRVEVLSRGNQYSAVPVEARDQSQIEIFGPRVGSTVQAHEICDEFIMGPAIAQTILQRALYVRTKFTFKLSWEYCLLDPMDIVTITDANLGLSNYPVRVIEIEEDDKGLLAFTCEELVTGVSNPAFNPNASSNGFQPNFGVPAVPVNTPLIVEPPLSLTGGVSQIWLGASGIGAGFNGQWGGAVVWMSIDGITYSQVDTLGSPLRQGFLTSSLPAAAGWDSVDTLAVNLAESGGTLSGTSQAAAQQGGTLSLVDGEFLGYEVATLTTVSNYNLTGLARGLGGSSTTAHNTGAPFARLDGAVGRFDLPANLAGKMLFFKFQSFNTLGGGLQDLSTCTVYTYATMSLSVLNPIFAQLQTGFPLDLGQVTDAPTLADDFGLVSAAVTASLDLGAIVVPVVHPIAAPLLLGSPVDLGLTTGAVTLSDDFGSTNDAVVDIINLGTVP
jgi:Putative phage tail protein